MKLNTKGLGWKGRESSKEPKEAKVITVSHEDLRKVQLMRVSRGFRLQLVLKNSTCLKFDGFKENVFLLSLSLFISLFF